MSPQSLIGLSLRLLSVYLFVAAAASLVYATSLTLEETLSDAERWTGGAPPYVHLFGGPIVLAAVALLLSRQWRWIAAWLSRGWTRTGAEEDPSLSRSALRTYGLSAVGFLALYSALRHAAPLTLGYTGDSARGGPYWIGGYLLLALGLLLGPRRLLRVVRGLPRQALRWDDRPVTVSGLERAALFGLGGWFAMLAIGRVLWRFEFIDFTFAYMQVTELVYSLALASAAALLIRAGVRRCSEDEPPLRIACEILGAALLLSVVSVAAGLTAALVAGRDFDPRSSYGESTLVYSPVGLFVVLVAVTLLLAGPRMRRAYGRWRADSQVE